MARPMPRVLSGLTNCVVPVDPENTQRASALCAVLEDTAFAGYCALQYPARLGAGGYCALPVPSLAGCCALQYLAMAGCWRVLDAPAHGVPWRV